MVNIVLTAQNFAFGPIGKLLYITDLLRGKGYCLTFVGFGTSLQLARKFPFDFIHELDTEEPSSLEELESIISKSDIVISSMDTPSVKIAKKLNKTVVWLDCLFWFWDEIPELLFDVDLYLKEYSLDTTINDNKYGQNIKNLLTVGPIMGKFNYLEKKKQAMISFGGGQATHFYQAGKDTNYPFVMTEILQKYVDWSGFDRIILATSETIVDELKSKFPNAPFEFTTLSHSQFLQELDVLKYY